MGISGSTSYRAVVPNDSVVVLAIPKGWEIKPSTLAQCELHIGTYGLTCPPRSVRYHTLTEYGREVAASALHLVKRVRVPVAQSPYPLFINSIRSTSYPILSQEAAISNSSGVVGGNGRR
ncbi:hypothetical protein EVAR_81402_1 [Eumeta japonica]|uniref:Uncharacterized protein n=1 Tax=Eumeta variegata TaxID=151549 RepID=A0A4C1WGZ3_EUMVA|nr:hypothetical protein EVAR_81402_1 [Eumeta japonica]